MKDLLYMVYDTLYGYDGAGSMRPQMCEGHNVSADYLTWTFTLRDGLMFHDKEKVLSRDCSRPSCAGSRATRSASTSCGM